MAESERLSPHREQEPVDLAGLKRRAVEPATKLVEHLVRLAKVETLVAMGERHAAEDLMTQHLSQAAAPE